jgi:hypothetical protein
LNRHLQDVLSGLIDLAVFPDLPGFHVRVAEHPRLSFEAAQLHIPGLVDPAADFVGRFPLTHSRKLIMLERGHVHMDVDAVQERTGDLGAVMGDVADPAGAGLRSAAKIAARAEILP